eukprot:3939423-Rhodomonas_salina.3
MTDRPSKLSFKCFGSTSCVSTMVVVKPVLKDTLRSRADPASQTKANRKSCEMTTPEGWSKVATPLAPSMLPAFVSPASVLTWSASPMERNCPSMHTHSTTDEAPSLDVELAGHTPHSKVAFRYLPAVHVEDAAAKGSAAIRKTATGGLNRTAHRRFPRFQLISGDILACYLCLAASIWTRS